MALNNYETVFILTPILSETQMKDAVQKFRQVLVDQKAEIINVEEWGIKQLAYEINHKTTGFYCLIEFKADPKVIGVLETEYRRDERILRFLTTVLDKFAVEYNEKRRGGKFNRKPANTETPAEA